MRAAPLTAQQLEHLAQQLALRRQELQLSRRAVARAAGISRTTLMYLERGTQQPSIRTLARVATGLQTTVAALITVPHHGSSRVRSPAEQLRQEIADLTQALGFAALQQLRGWALHLRDLERAALQQNRLPPEPQRRQSR